MTEFKVEMVLFNVNDCWVGSIMVCEILMILSNLEIFRY